MKNKISVGDTVRWQNSDDGLAVVVRKEKDEQLGVSCWIYHSGGDVSQWRVEDLELHEKHIDMRNRFLVEMEELDRYVHEQMGGN